MQSISPADDFRLHPRKTVIFSTSTPAPFLGFVLQPGGGRRRLPEDNVRRFRNRLRSLRDRYHSGAIDMDRLLVHIQSWNAHADHADSWRLRDAIFRDVVFYPGNRGVAFGAAA